MEAVPDEALAYGIFSVRQAMAAGFSRADIERAIARGAWLRSAWGVLEVSDRPSEPTDPVVRTVLQAGPRAVLGLAGAARLHGWDLPRLPQLPLVVLPPGCKTRLASYRSRLAEDEVIALGPIVLTSPARTAADLAVVLERDAAVVVLDSVLRAGVSSRRIEEAVARRRSRAARRAFELADPLSGSVPESEARMLMHGAGLPPPCSQFVIRLGDAIYRVDFAWPAHRLVVEIDGREFHIGEAPFQTDRTRQNALLQAGWHVLRFTVADVRLRPRYVIAEIRFALEKASTHR